MERISAYEKIGWSTLKTDYVYDGRGSVSQELTYNSSWYAFGGFLSNKGVNSYTYTPFGETLTGEGSGFRFNGEYYDSATGMLNLRARQYEPSAMRFVQRDLLKGDQSAPLSLNRYLYCENDSVNFVDPSGRSIADLWNKAKTAVSNGVAAVKKVTAAAKNVVSVAKENVKSFITETKSKVSNSVAEAKAEVKNGIIKTAAKITSAATTLTNNVKTTISNTRTNVLDWYGRNEETITKCLKTAAVVLGTVAVVALTVASAGAVAAAAGVMFAGTALAGSAATLATIGVYGLAAVTGLFGASNVGEIWSGYNVIRDSVFCGNQTAYDYAQAGLAVLSMGTMQFGSYNSGLLRNAPTADDPADEVAAGSAGKYAGRQAAGATQSGSAGSTPCTAGQVDEGQALQTYYPPNDGFLHEPELTTLNPGTYIDRYGYPGGNYASPAGTPAEMRALPYGSIDKPYTMYEVVKPVNALSGQAASWFGQIGLGIQFKFALSFEEMIKQGIIREVVN